MVECPGSMLRRIIRGGLDVLAAPELDEEYGISVTFTGRSGGVSEGPFAGLNLSYNVGDGHRAVSANRGRLAKAIGISPDGWVACQQVHGARVRVVGPMERGRGGLDFHSALPRTDGLITGISGLALTVLTADCVPLVLVAPQEMFIGVAHAGWKGVLAGVCEVALNRLMDVSRCGPDRVMVFLGPHIGGCCFQVDQVIKRDFANKFGQRVIVEGTGSNKTIDLGAACVQSLAEAGLEERNVFSAGVCTCCDDGYFSYRRSGGLTGRQAVMVAVSGARHG